MKISEKNKRLRNIKIRKRKRKSQVMNHLILRMSQRRRKERKEKNIIMKNSNHKILKIL